MAWIAEYLDQRRTNWI